MPQESTNTQSIVTADLDAQATQEDASSVQRWEPGLKHPLAGFWPSEGKTMNGVYESNQDYVRVLLADDAAVIRNSVSRLLESEPAIKLMGVAENFSQTLQMAASLRPDVVLLDLHMPDSGAFEPAFVKSELALSGARVLGMSLSSGEDDEELQVLAESFGVATLLDKGRFGNELIPAILQK